MFSGNFSLYLLFPPPYLTDRWGGPPVGASLHFFLYFLGYVMPPCDYLHVLLLCFYFTNMKSIGLFRFSVQCCFSETFGEFILSQKGQQHGKPNKHKTLLDSGTIPLKEWFRLQKKLWSSHNILNIFKSKKLLSPITFERVGKCLIVKGRQAEKRWLNK